MKGPSPVARRVVHVITRYEAGGSERRLRDLVAATPQHDHHVVVGAGRDPELLRSHLGGVPVHVQRWLRRAPHPVHDLLALRALLRLFGDLRPDLVVTHQSKAGVLGRLAAARCGLTVMHSLSMATFGVGYPRPVTAVFRIVERAMAPLTAAYAVVGHDLAREYRALGVPADRLHIVRSAAVLPTEPVDRCEATTALRRQAGFAPDRPVLAYVGSLDARKNVLALVDLLETAQRAATVPPCLVIAGDGPLRDNLERRVRARGLDGDVAFLGHLDDPAPVFQGADAVVLCSRAEGLPQVLVQASAAGTPFVAFQVTGTDELVAAGAVGEVVPWGDTAAAAAAVVRVLDAPRTGRRVDLSEWSPDGVRARYATLVRALLDAPTMARGSVVAG